MPWYFICYFFCLKATVKTNTWMRMIPVTVMVFISKVLFWKLLDFSYVQTGFEIHFTFEDFTGHGSTYMLLLLLLLHLLCIILSWLNIMKWKWSKVPWKLLVAQKSEPVLWRTLHQKISLIIVLFLASEINLVFKFNLVLIEQFLLQFAYL